MYDFQSSINRENNMKFISVRSEFLWGNSGRCLKWGGGGGGSLRNLS